MRRRYMMMKKINKEDWDIDWNYKMGDLTVLGFDKTVYRNANSKIVDNGLELWSDDNGYIRYICPVETTEKGIVEVEFTIKSFSATAISVGFRLILSNGNLGNHIAINKTKTVEEKGEIRYDDGSNYNNFKKLSDLNENTRYKIRLEFDYAKKTNKVFLDDEEILTTSELSDYYIDSNRIFQQQGGTTILHSLRYKFN